MTIVRTLQAYAGIVLLASSTLVFSADQQAAGGAAAGVAAPNANRAAVAGSNAALPWPEPDAQAVATMTAELQRDLSSAFQISRVGPWIVATDLDAVSAKRFVQSTLAIYGAAIQQQLFTKKALSEPVKVYLFKDKDSYELWNKKLFGKLPSTPYGFYSRTSRALVMNIGTGGGTLLHEMVHAMAEADFPEIPAWLNEGIGSLFEASGPGARGRVQGLTNWRLPGLQRAIRERNQPLFQKLLSMDDDEFYGANSGLNYAAARYLMMFLQQHGKLETFYTRVRDKSDPSPQDTLRFCFDNKLTLKEIETNCYNWVRTLTFGTGQ